MPHKFKIGQTVNYHPKDRMLSTARGTYTVTGLMPALEASNANIGSDTSAKTSSGSPSRTSCRQNEVGKAAMRELTYISLLAGFCSGLAAALDRGLFALMFAAASTFTAYAAFRRPNKR